MVKLGMVAERAIRLLLETLAGTLLAWVRECINTILVNNDYETSKTIIVKHTPELKKTHLRSSGVCFAISSL